jgi:hypothetical protein
MGYGFFLKQPKEELNLGFQSEESMSAAVEKHLTAWLTLLWC